jgi:membrane fusion protein (multidrug efflux system)
VWLAAAASAAALMAAAGPGEPASYPCISRPSDSRELAFALRGRVEEVFVKPGDVVEVGTPMVRLDDTTQRQTVELARMEVEDTTPVRSAQSSLEYALQTLERTRKAFSDQGANEAQLRQAEYEHEVAALKVESSEREARANALALAREETRLEQMTITSPVRGSVLEVHKRRGESVDELTTVVTVITVDPLWVEVNVPTREALALEVGREAIVEWEDADGVEPMTGRVIFRSPAAHAGARQVQVRVEVANPAGLPSGLHGTVRFGHAPATGARGATVTPTGRSGRVD